MRGLLVFLAILLGGLSPLRADVLVLVHGYMSDARTWEFNGIGPVLAAHGWQPAGVLNAPLGMAPPPAPAAGRFFYTVNLPAAAPLLVQADHLARLVATVRQRHPDERLIVAGHSAGGVVARLLVLNGNPFAVDTLISIASPHLGTWRAEQGLDVVDFNPFFCPGPGLELMKSVLGGDDYDYLRYSRGALLDLRPAASGNVLTWLNQQPHAAIRYIAVVRASPYAPGDRVVPAYSQDMNNVPALHGRVRRVETPAGHGLNPQDGRLLAALLAGG